MKQLLMVRHGKSDWGNVDLADFDRPLNSRGKKNASEMAARLLKQGFNFDLMVSSPAKRAKSTAKRFAKVFKYGDITYEPSIYEAGTSNLLLVVNKLDNQFQKVILFGHNPGFTDFANQLTNADIYNLPTAGIVVITFPFDNWKMVSMGTGELALFDYPKNEGDGD
ncbi:phosphohistidine phosphatase [Pedobacter sp. UYP30]|uniref:SixA phosphatase family protein n=1 Tax=Pedobacter sp. UYP30 TaxID=1756400 RepID=UPI00339A2DD7